MTCRCQYDRVPYVRKILNQAQFCLFSGLLGLALWALPGPLTAQAVDPARQHAAELLEQLESGLDTLQAGDFTTYKALTGLLASSRQSIRSMVGDSDPEVRHLSDRWDEARERLVTVAESWLDTPALSSTHPAEALARSAGSLLRDMENVPVAALSNPEIHSHFTNRVFMLHERLLEMGGGEHVAPARAAIGRLEAFLLENGPGNTRDDLFLKYMPGNRRVLRPGAGPAETAEWFSGMKALSSTAVAEDSRALAQDIAAGRRERSAAGVFKRSVVDRWIPDIMSEITDALAGIDARVAAAVSFADDVLRLEVTSPRDVGRLAGPANYQRTMDRLQKGVAALAVASAADEAIGRERGPDREQQKARLREAKNAMALLRHAADKQSK